MAHRRMAPRNQPMGTAKEKKEKVKKEKPVKFLYLAKIEVKYKDRILSPTIRFPQGTIIKGHIHTVGKTFKANDLIGAKRKAEKFVEEEYEGIGKLINLRKL